MRAALAPQIGPIQATFESRVPYFYLDIEGLVTIGIGCLAEYKGQPEISSCLDFQGASKLGVLNSWRYVKSRQDLAKKGGGTFGELPQNKARATMASIDLLADMRAAEFEAHLSPEFPGWEDRSADEQLGIFLMAWAYGAFFPPKWPKFTAALNARDWPSVLKECVPSPEKMAKQNDSFHRRVTATVQCFKNASIISAQAIDPENLQYPLLLEG